MLSLIDPTTVPPGGFRYIQPETNATLYAPSFPELLSKVKNHRLANNLPIPLEWKADVEQWLCEQLPGTMCRHLAGTRDIPFGPTSRPLSLQEAISGIQTLGAWMFKGFSKITQEEADARSKICVSCPFNQHIDGCTTCASDAMRQVVENVLGKSRTINHDNLQTCEVCGCSLKVSVWVPKELLDKYKSQEQRDKAPSFCWLK